MKLHFTDITNFSQITFITIVYAATILKFFLLSGNQGGVQGNNNYSVGNESKFNCLIACNHLKNTNPISHTAWLGNHAPTFKSTTENYYFFGEKYSFLHTILKFSC
jgi:hypothetical protein